MAANNRPQINQIKEANKMKKFRTIYIVEAITEDGELVMRRFARNKKIAEKIARQCKKS